MARRHDRADKVLPVTGEVGSEGGSYADATLQVPTFSDHRGIEYIDGHGGASSVAANAVDHLQLAGGGIGTNPDPVSGMVRYATEPPPAAPERQGAASLLWRAGALGAVAGAAGSLLAMALMRRQRHR